MSEEISWFPTLEEYNPNISKEKWLEILDDRNLTTEQNLHILACMYNIGGESTCTQLAQKYGDTINTYNSGSSNYAKRIVKAKICDEPPFRESGDSRWWPVLYVGHDADSETPGSYVWKLRDELKEACKEYGIEKWLEISFLNDFTWIPFYEEISHALLRYKENRLDLVNILVSSLNELGINSGMYRNENGPLTNIDPFTFIGGFNRGNKREDRIKIANRIAEKIGIESRLSEEENFYGIPTLNSEHSTLFYRGCPENDYDKLWNLFEASLNFDLFSPEVFIEAFDNALSVTGTGQKYATMASFWINPYNILAVDENNINYLNKYGISVSSNLTGSTYIDLLRQITTKMEKHEITETTFPDFSHAAWKFPKRSYWACGFHYGDENEDNQYERFITNSIWSARFQKDKTRDLKQLERAKKIKEGDVLVLKTSFVRDRKISITKLYAIGIVKGEKKITEDATYSYYTIDVEYNAIDDRPEFGCTYMETIMEIRNDELKSFVMNNMGDVAMGKNPNDLNKYIDLLTENKNIILHGAPGTGKTYLAKQIAESMGCSKDEIGFCQFHPSYDYTDFVEGLRPTKNNGFERKDGTFKTFCKKALRNLIDSKKTAEERSQEKSIEEQISSFISDSVDNEIEYELLGRKTKFTITNYDEKKIYISAANKIAKEIEVKISDLVEILSSKKDFGQAKEIAKFFNHPNYGYQSDSYVFALYKQLISVISDKKSDSIESRVEKKTFVFIIDEINRGELSKIFGELFFSIDPGYRGEEGRVNTQYQNLIEDDLFTDGFYIPENVYIIGTMNDIDRSVESMDFAMRRRFTFVEVTAEESAENMKITGEALQKMNSINQIISKMPELGKSYCIGAAYFKNAEDLQKLWDLKISSLVYEYLRGIDNYSDEHKDGEKFDEIKSAYENPDSVVLDK